MSSPAAASDRGRQKLPHLSKQDLSARRVGLLELMQSINFGRIHGLVVRGREPILDPPPRVVREVKFGGENGPRPERDAANFYLKTQVVELFQYLDQLGDGTIEVLEVKHGLPFRMLVARGRRVSANGNCTEQHSVIHHSPDYQPAALRQRWWATPIWRSSHRRRSAAGHIICACRRGSPLSLHGREEAPVPHDDIPSRCRCLFPILHSHEGQPTCGPGRLYGPGSP